MNRIKYRITLDMLEVATQTTLKAKKGDTACSIIITLTEKGKHYNIAEGCYAVFSAKKPDGNYLFNSETCYIEDNAIVYDFTEQTTPCEGTVECEVVLYKGEEKLTSPRFYLVVDPTVYNGEEVESSTETDAYKKFTKTLEEHDEQLDVVSKQVAAIEETLPKYTKDDIDPIFANNSWETIAKVARYGDPSKYWKVGDYKMVKMPKTNEVYDVYPFDLKWDYYGEAVEVYDKELFLSLVGNREGVYSVGHTTEGYYWIEGVTDKLEDVGVRGALGESEYARVAVIKSTITGEPFSITTVGDNSPADYKVTVADVQKFLSTINYVSGAYYAYREEVVGNIEEVLKNEKGEVLADKVLGGKGFAQIGLSIPNYYYEGKTIIVVKEAQDEEMVYTEVPLQIIGFNHDKVTDPYNYGKQKAGMTLQLGASRNVYGDTKPSLYEGTIEGLMRADGLFKAPNRVKVDFSDGATNWADGGFRVALQTLFDGTEIAPYLAEVKKQTSHHWQESQRWAALMDTNDKVFLPSEYEYFGEVLYAPAKEGEQYELYREGTSKFMWNKKLLDGTATTARIHFRSAVGSKVNTDKVDSMYNCGMYISVKSLDPVSVSYAHSYASGGGYIAPCICL